MNIGQPTSREKLVGTATEVAANLRALEAGNQQHRMLHPDAIALISDAGLFKLIQPARIGGMEADIPTLQAVGRALSLGCAATGWVYLVTGAHTWILGSFPQAAQDELHADDPNTFVPGSLASNGKAQIVDGGFQVSGRWQFASGCDYGRWALLCSMQSDSTREDPKHIHYLVPASDFAIEDTWYTLGLRGTGSKDIVVENAFVPAHRTMPTGDLFEGVSPHAQAHDSFVYEFPVLASLTFLVTGAAMALADRIYAEFVSLTSHRRDRYDGSTKAKKATVQARLGESWSEIQCAELLVGEIASTFDKAREKRQAFDVQTRLDVKMRASYAVTLCRRASDRLFDAAGANSIYERSALLPLIQNLHTASHHAIIDFDNNATAFGSQALGLGPGTILY
jgi:alkylation response protein AidB-like acyl-CoA dehydrogenase